MSSLSEILCNTLARIFDRVAACCCCCCRYAIERKKAQIELSSPRNTILHRTYTVCRCLCICITIEKQNKMNWSQIYIARFVWVVISVKTNIFFAFLENISRTTRKASAYHQWYAYHRLGTRDLDQRHSQDLKMRYSIRKKSTKNREHVMCKRHINFR